MAPRTLGPLFTIALIFGCSSSNGPGSGASSGGGSSGGATATGATTGSGGTVTASGGTTASGGNVIASGGNTSSGGTTASGGASSSGATGSGGVLPDSGTDDTVTVHWAEPAPNSTVKGKDAPFRLTGTSFLNVEIQANGATISTCTVSADQTTATCSVDTTTLPNGAITLTAHAWNSPAGTPSTSDADAGPLTVNVDNPSAPASTYGDFIGVCAYQASELPKLQALGMKNARWDHPSAELIERARTYGVEVLPLASYGFPDLSGQADDKYPPTPQNRGEWSRRMVDTWRSMARPPKVIEVWNEPWLQGFWKPSPDPAAYLELVKAFAKEAWAVWPDVTLLVSADEGYNGYDFRAKVLEADTTGFLNDPRIRPTTHDYVEGRTPTQVTGEPCKYDLDRWKCAYDAYKAHGHPNPEVWVTEFGWETDTPGGRNDVTPVTEAQQSQYTVDAFKAFKTSGKVAKAFSFLYHLNDPWNYNWVRPDNSEKPVCSAVKGLIQSSN